MILSGFDPNWQENVICPFIHPWKARWLFVIVMQFRMSSKFQDLKNSLQSLTWTICLMFSVILIHIPVCCTYWYYSVHIHLWYLWNAAGQGVWPNHAHVPSHSCWRKHHFIYWTVFFKILPRIIFIPYLFSFSSEVRLFTHSVITKYFTFKMFVPQKVII